jgi:phosphatidylinositol alpha-1,6-mannosyltransferase
MSLALKIRYRVPYICYAHGEDITTALDSREHAWLVRRVLRNARLLIANSHNTAKILREQWELPGERVCVLHPGVDTGYFTPTPADVAMRRRLGWKERAVVLTVGRLQKRKGHDMLVRALVEIRKTVPSVLYAIAGAGEERQPLGALVAELKLEGHVQFLGEISDAELLGCYQQCDLFVLPNRQVGQDIEGFGMVLLEAQACGKPVVAGNSGGTAETMRIPQTGQVVSCDGPDELAGLVAGLLADRPRREGMGEAARAWVVERFDWEALARQAEQLFEGGPAGQPPARVPEAVCS